jgi:hypothetical protein
MSKTANKVIEQARAWLGRNEASGTHKAIIDIYNSHKPLARGYKVKYTDAWCATFVSAVAIKLGYTDIIPTECGCEEMIKKFKGIGAWIENENRTPQPGEIVFYDWQDNGKGDNVGYTDHVGIVEKVVGNTITIIEGNINNSVGRRVIKVNAKGLRGYATPKYDIVVDELAEACKLLASKGIINSPDYWAKGTGYSEENTILLIKKFARYVKGD